MPNLLKGATDSEDNVKIIHTMSGRMFILAALNKNDQNENIVNSAIVTFCNLVVATRNEESAKDMLRQLRPAGLSNAIVQAL